MDLALTPEQIEFRKLFRDFADKEVAKLAEHIDEHENIPAELLQKAAAQGFFGASIPEDLGGLGFDSLSRALMLEELGKRCLSTAIALATHNALACHSIVAFGTAAQKEKYLGDMAAGERIGAFALTEADTGHDLNAVSTTATKVEAGYLLNGTKTWVTNAGIADVFIVFALTDPNKKGNGLSAFIVDKDTPGLVIGYREPTLGLRGLTIHTIHLEDCTVPADALLGTEHQAAAILAATADEFRLALAAVALGASEAALDLGMSFVSERKQFGTALANKQALQNYVADTLADIESLRGLIYIAAHAPAKDFHRATTIAKYVGARASKDAANKMLQSHGGYGFSSEYPISRIYRDVRALRILGGTDEVHRVLIARAAFAEKGVTLQA